MSDYPILQKVVRSDEQFFWNVTGSIADVKYNPWYWFLTVITFGIFLISLYYKRIFTSYSLTDKRLLIVSGIFTKKVDEIELFRITDSTTEQGVIDMWADLGDITVSSTDFTGTIVMRKIPNPYQIRDSLRKQYMAARQAKGTVLMETLNSPPPPSAFR